MLCLHLGEGTDSVESQHDRVDTPALNPEPLAPLVCLKCYERFTSTIEHQRHLHTLHSHEVQKCKQCDAQFFSVTGWIEHLTRQHIGTTAAIMHDTKPPWVYKPSNSPEKERLELLFQELVRLDTEVKDASWDLPPAKVFLRTFFEPLLTPRLFRTLPRILSGQTSCLPAVPRC